MYQSVDFAFSEAGFNGAGQTRELYYFDDRKINNLLCYLQFQVSK